MWYQITFLNPPNQNITKIGYHRKALAHKALGDDTAAYETYVVAGKKCVKDAWLQREMKKSKKEMLRAHVEKPVKSIEHMVSIFSYMEDIWDRLSCLAYFWNAATQEERHKIFARLYATQHPTLCIALLYHVKLTYFLN